MGRTTVFSLVLALLIAYVFMNPIGGGPGPTPTPTSSPMPSPMGNYINGVWMSAGDLSSSALDRLATGNIRLIFLKVGEWRSDGTILYFIPYDVITNFISTVKARMPDAKVLAWVYNVPGYQQSVNLGSLSIRQTMISQTLSCVAKGFDGFNDDVEIRPSDWNHIIDYWNGQANALRAAGKMATIAISAAIYYEPNWIYTVAPRVHVDYAAAMLYNNRPFYPESDFRAAMNGILTYSASPVLIGMIDYDSTYTLKIQQGWVDTQINNHGAYSKLAGFALFHYAGMRDTDWTDWNSWATKN